ncbi:hypothetical protein Tco_0672026 [Tanacetum coccineum]
MTNLTDMLTKVMNVNTASTSGTGSLPSNTVANPRGEMKAITTRSGVSYDGPQVPYVTGGTKDTVQPSTENIQPPEVQTQNDEPVVAPKTKPTIPYPSRINKENAQVKMTIFLALKIVSMLFLDVAVRSLLKLPTGNECADFDPRDLLSPLENECCTTDALHLHTPHLRQEIKIEEITTSEPSSDESRA